MRKIAPILLALALLAFFLARANRRTEVGAPARNEGGAGPEDCVRAMFTAAQEGRTADYLDCFCDPLRPSLDDTARSMGEQKFREYIQASVAPVTGTVFSDVVERSPDEAALRWELVFKDRNEVQRLTLRRTGGRWRISGMTPAERIQPPVPYGTKVYE